MKHLAKLDSSGVIFGYAFSDSAPSDEWVEVGVDLSQVSSTSTFLRLIDGEVIDTGQPKLPPQPWLSWSSQDLSWVDLRDLEQMRTAKLEEIKSARETAEYGGFLWDGSVFDSDAASQQRIIGASQLATLTPGFMIDWTLADNTVRTLNAQEMNAVGMALGQHVNAQHTHARALRQEAESAQSAEELAAIQW